VTAPTLALVASGLTATSWSLVAVTLLVLAVVTVLCVLRARRLDRLHRRTDAARAGLADALERRGQIALRVADALDLPPPPGNPQQPRVATGRGGGADGAAVRAAARDALRACRAGLRTAGGSLDPCELAENTLTRRLAAVDRDALPGGLAGELL
jgi:heme exporter protein D